MQIQLPNILLLQRDTAKNNHLANTQESTDIV